MGKSYKRLKADLKIPINLMIQCITVDSKQEEERQTLHN